LSRVDDFLSATHHVCDISALADSPLQHLHSSFLRAAEIQLYVKRDDLIHPEFGGNKWRKLKYNLIQASEQHYDTLLTFGGAWSNHIYATAAAGKHFGFKTIGIIRGEEHDSLNHTLTFARDCGMQLYYIDRAQYRKKHDDDFLREIRQRFGEVYILPEGGSNALALKGCKQIIDEINEEMSPSFDFVCCASGTGATLAGLISCLSLGQRAIGFSALKGGEFLNDEVRSFLSQSKSNTATQKNHDDPGWEIQSEFHFGGYAKVNDELIQFMATFRSEYGFALDAVYTGKMFYGIFKLIERGYFKPGSRIVAIHSGGLQGNIGFGL
jgi:1-aminocyclopropane-1-carboxylate deaminase/D-cysteine desulfhydrase-like pyridoxal-dependent ACC family enzyme